MGTTRGARVSRGALAPSAGGCPPSCPDGLSPQGGSENAQIPVEQWAQLGDPGEGPRGRELHPHASRAPGTVSLQWETVVIVTGTGREARAGGTRPASG